MVIKRFGKQMLALTLSMLLLSSCGSSGTANPSVTGTPSPSGTSSASSAPEGTAEPGIVFPADKGENVKITLYPQNASLTSGTVSGWRGDFFAENGLTVEVWAYSNEKTNAILASGDLPDVMYVNSNILETMIEGDMLLNLDPYLADLPHVSGNGDITKAISYAREFKSADTGKLYYFPLSVGPGDYGYDTERNGLRLNWEVYEQIGAPEFNDLYELIPILKQMQAAKPTADDGSKNYAALMFSSHDTTQFFNMFSYYSLFGYNEGNLPFLVETDMINATHKSILESDSMYYQGLKWFNALYREGLLDPDSLNYDRNTQQAKYKTGNPLMSLAAGPGWEPYYYQSYFNDEKVYYPNINTYGNVGLAISSHSSNPEAALAFCDLLADPDRCLVLRDGPEGDFWYKTDDGKAFLSDGALDPTKIGQTYVFKDGSAKDLWNTAWLINLGTFTSFKDSNGELRRVRAEKWDEALESAMKNNPNFLKWQKTTGAENWVELLTTKKALYTTSPFMDVGSFMSVVNDDTKLIMESLKDKVVNASWKMVYADSDATFEGIWKQMVSDCEALGAKDIIQYFLDEFDTAMAKRDSIK